MKYKNGEKIIFMLLFLFIILNCFSLKEGYNNYSDNVDLPINTKYSCKNMCGPHATCSLTGEQCTSDIDCYGCQPTNQTKKNLMDFFLQLGSPAAPQWDNGHSQKQRNLYRVELVPLILHTSHCCYTQGFWKLKSLGNLEWLRI